MNLTSLPEWQALLNHQREMSEMHLRTLFQDDPERFKHFSINAANLLLDYSKNRVTAKTMDLLIDLAKASKLDEQIKALFTGAHVNQSEERPALHTALRNLDNETILVDGADIMPIINDARTRLVGFATAIRTQQWRGYSGKPITDIINIGIGGSDLGPLMAIEALAPYNDTHIKFHFVSNIDGTAITETLNKIHPETSLFIISSKSFSTTETLANAQTAREWFSTQSSNAAFDQHFIAVTAQADKAQEFGINPANIYPLWDWVGGRYSVWSAIGLPILLAIGVDNFQALLAGAHEMDNHFKQTDFSSNMPVVLGLLDIWYNNFFAATTRAVFPYAQALKHFPDYLQQVQMESLGKRVNHDGKSVDYTTGQVIFGKMGNDAQHSFYQLLHQGTATIPTDFIVPVMPHHALHNQQNILLANALAQSKALMEGKTFVEALAEMTNSNYAETKKNRLAQHKIMPGNQPSNMILLPQLNPYSLGALVALYEHRIFVQSAIWQINAFDQWGVELGKQLANDILPGLQTGNIDHTQDSSTRGLLEYCWKIKNL